MEIRQDIAMMPDFLIIPYQLIADERVTPVEERVYAVVYWMRSMRLERCSARNETLARFAKTSVRMVQRSLEHLEELGYVERIMEDGERIDILPLVTFGRHAGTSYRTSPHVLQDVPPRPTGRPSNKEDKDISITPPYPPQRGERAGENRERPKTGVKEPETGEVSHKGVKSPGRAGLAPHTASLGYLDSVPSDDLREWTARFIVTEKQIKSTAEDLRLYCERKKKTYKNYRAFLLSAIKRDYKERDENSAEMLKYKGL